MKKEGIKLSAIVAMTSERIIGKDNDLPWRLPEDLKMFKRTTSGYPIVMGRKTWDSLGKYKPLPNRRNIVITRDKDWSEEGATVIHSPAELQRLNLEKEQVYIIGGAEIYQLFLPLLDELIVSHVYENHEGDTKFPEFSERFETYEVLETYPEFEVRKYAAKQAQSPKPKNKDPLHGVTLERMLNELVDEHGWEDLAFRIRINCFSRDPSVKSSLKFLRKTPWARAKVEDLYLIHLGLEPSEKSQCRDKR